MTVYSESFEAGLGSWVNDPGNLYSNWVRHTGSTGSSNTGPSGAYSGSYYIYCETSSGSGAYTAGDTDIIEYDMGGAQNGDIDFWYHQDGSNQGTLYLEGYNGATWDALWSSTGDQGASWINVNQVFTEKSKLRFRNVAAGGYEGDVALDLIVVTHIDPAWIFEAVNAIREPFNLGAWIAAVNGFEAARQFAAVNGIEVAMQVSAINGLEVARTIAGVNSLTIAASRQFVAVNDLVGAGVPFNVAWAAVNTLLAAPGGAGSGLTFSPYEYDSDHVI